MARAGNPDNRRRRRRSSSGIRSSGIRSSSGLGEVGGGVVGGGGGLVGGTAGQSAFIWSVLLHPAALSEIMVAPLGVSGSLIIPSQATTRRQQGIILNKDGISQAREAAKA